MSGGDASANGSRESNPGAETRDMQNAAAQDQPPHERQEKARTQPSSPPTTKPSPPSRQESPKRWQPLPPPHPVYSVPLPVDQLHDQAEPGRPDSPIWWHKTKLGLLLFSLMVCAVIFGIGIALGYRSVSRDSLDLRYGVIDVEFGLSAGGAGLATVVTALEFLKTLCSRRKEGLHPGLLVAAHLIIWLVVLAAVAFSALFTAYATQLSSQTAGLQRTLLAFNCILMLIHFVLFVDACVMTNQLNRASRKTVVVTVPVQVGAGYPGVPYPVYGYPSSYVPPQGDTKLRQQPVPLMTPIPPQTAEGTSPALSQPAAVYAGYYAPTSQEPASPGGQMSQGYYEPVPAPTAADAAGSSRSSQRPAPSAPAKTPGP